MKRQIWHGKFREEVYPGYPKEDMAIEIGVSHDMSTKVSQEDVVRGGVIAMAPGHDWQWRATIDDKPSDLGGLISDIEAENDDYARTVIPLIKRILADDYSQTGLFGEIASALDRVEKGEMTLCAHKYSPEAKCGLAKGHAGNHEATVEDRDPETRLLLGTRNIQWPNV